MASDDIQVVKLPLEEPLRAQRRRLVVTIGASLLASAPLFVVVIGSRHAQVEAIDAFWRVEGRPCPPLSAERFHNVSRPPSVTPYDEARFARHGGAMTCTHRTDPIDGVAVRYPVCKFSAPDYLAVTAAGQERFYDLTMGRAAAVGVVNGQVKCAVVAKFEM